MAFPDSKRLYLNNNGHMHKYTRGYFAMDVRTASLARMSYSVNK